jgi:DNA-binding response OmpR family regulator
MPSSDIHSQQHLRQPHVLIIEDDPFVRAGLQGFLQAEGFSTALAASPDEARQRLRQRVPDLVLLDLYLGEGNKRVGLDLGLSIKREFDIPIIIITIEEDADVQISAVNNLAEYYLVKPLDRGKLGLLRAYIQRALGHYGGTPSQDYTQHILGPTVRVNLYQRWVERRAADGWVRERLSPTENALLVFLLRNQGQVLTYDALASQLRLAGPRANQHTAVRMHIANLRKKLGDDAEHPCIIRSIRGVGYQMVISPSPAEESIV